MAPVLQCPDCNTKHPIDVAPAAVFRCNGCGRTLKVPPQFQHALDPDRTAAVPATGDARPSPNGGHPLSRRNVRAQAGVVPFWIRLLVWLVAVPLGFVLVFGFARAIGVLSQSQLEDVFLETGWDRFWPVARLLPFVALVTAAIVHFSVLFISRWRIRHAVGPLQPRMPVAPPRSDAPTTSA